MDGLRHIKVDEIDRAAGTEAGPAPMLQWIEIDNLVVDERYQRDLKRGNWTAIRKIAAGFRWSRFSPVLVAPVEGGLFAIIDGQHRSHAAALCGFDRVPCQVVQMDLEEQAASFAAVNGAVTKVTVRQIFKAALAARDEWAVACAKVVSDAGCVLMTRNGDADSKKPGEIYAIGLIRQHVEAGQDAAVTMALRGIRQSESGEDAAAYTNEIIKPLISALVDRPWIVKHGTNLAPFLDEFDIWAALDRSAEFSRNRRRQGATGISKFDMAAAEIGEGLDRAFPQRIALPASEAA